MKEIKKISEIINYMEKINNYKNESNIIENFIKDITGKEFKYISVIARDKNGNKKVYKYKDIDGTTKVYKDENGQPAYYEKTIRVESSYDYKREIDEATEGKIKYPIVYHTKDILIRKNILTHFILNEDLLNKGYVEYKVEDLCNICNLSMSTHERTNSMKNVRREIDHCVKLGLFNKYKSVVTILNLPQHVDETDGAHYKRCRTTKGGLNQDTTWRITLTREFYDKIKRIGYDYDKYIFTNEELNKIDEECKKWSKENSYRIKEKEYLKKFKNDEEIKQSSNNDIIEEANPTNIVEEDYSVYYEEPIVPITDEDLEESSKEYLNDIEDEEISNNDEDYTIQPKQSTLDNVRNRKLNRTGLGAGIKCINTGKKLPSEIENENYKEVPEDLSELEFDQIFVDVIGVTSEIGERIYNETKEQLGFNNNRNITDEDYDNYFEIALIAIAKGEINPGNVSNIQYVKDIFNSIRHKLNYYN